jgi:hypothetical protein
VNAAQQTAVAELRQRVQALELLAGNLRSEVEQKEKALAELELQILEQNELIRHIEGASS